MIIKKNKEINSKKYVDLMGTVGTMGMHMVTHPAVGAGIGYFLDDWLGTKPWLFIAFLILGVVAGFRAVFLDTRKIMRNQEKQDAERFGRKD
ncbi:AtpZ/AtpI family protein [Desulfovibrio mangrovi]|uniref:AtpZ/AtpI family protein n=1 Tax=Desulfovibrio mangrovi TaxID=2976983 RepID=UPI0022485AA4|nr:AtpZ/AtpI family protein [Desulfovibrio mangrovi]UZP69044.1 AtpZ/AtpI family protein [Desulfovibrio mangrovi]